MDITKTAQQQTAGSDSIQNQLFGDNSSQTVIEKQVVNYGIPVGDVIEFTTSLSAQVTKQALVQCTEIATEIATDRIAEFEKKWIPRIKDLDNTVSKLQSPDFQFMLLDAKITAVKSTREDDLAMLSELLACHIDKGDDLKVDAGIKRAIKIVNEVDDDALCALTVVDSLLTVCPVSGFVRLGVSALNDLYSKLLYVALPEGYPWIDHLSVLGAINLMTGRFYSLKQNLSEYYDGYCCAGIKINSAEHIKALEILSKQGISTPVFVANECLDGYIRLPIVSKRGIKPEFQPILDLYTKDSALNEQAKDAFMSIWDSFATLKTIREWYERIPVWFRINSVGHALSQTNGKRCDPKFPDLV